MDYMFDDEIEQSETIVDEIRKKYEEVRNRIEESRRQIGQSEAEIGNLQANFKNADYQLRQIQDNFDSVPRADIRVAYDHYIEIQKRQSMYHAQMERLKANLGELEAYEDLFRRILDEIDDEIVDTGSSIDEVKRAPRLSASGEMIIRIVEAQEDERQVLAKQLHDGPAQSLSNFILQAEVCQRLFDRNPDRAASELGNLKTAASDSFQKVRDFIFGLRPMMLDDLGLIPTLRRYAENVGQKSDELSVNFRSTSEERRIAKHAEVMMFRSIQQLITLGIEHLAAENIDVQVDIGADEVRAIIEDNGRGFDPDVELDPKNGDSNVQVLNSLRDRIELVGGEIDIYSSEGNGARYAISLPLFETEQEPDFG